MAMPYNELLDLSDQKATMALVKTRRALNDLPVGSILKVITSDEKTVEAFKNWAEEVSNITLLEQETEKPGRSAASKRTTSRTSSRRKRQTTGADAPDTPARPDETRFVHYFKRLR